MKYIAYVLLMLSFSFVNASESSVYDFSWLDQDKEVYVLQNRKFRKVKRVYLGAMLGTQVNGAFIESNEIGIQGGFFLREDWGFEVSYSKSSGQTNKTYDGVNEQGAQAFYRKMDSSMSAMLLWSPFYAKINTFNKIFYYDWMFGVGLANVTTLDNRESFGASGSSEELTQETNMAPIWMTSFRFYITDNWSAEMRFEGMHLNADVARQNASSVERTEKSWAHYYDFKLGLNYTF